MSCDGCGKKATKAGVQKAVRFRAFAYNGSLKTIDGKTPDDFRALPDFPVLLLGVRLEFSDNTSRTVSGHRWIYMIEDKGAWTIDDDSDANSVLTKYPRAILKQGGTVVEPVMQAVNSLLRDPV